MPIASTDIDFFFSGGAANSDPNACLGGAISSTQVTNNSDNNMFDDVSGAESSAGDVEYRAFYVKNSHGSLTLTSPKLYISTDSQSDIDIAIADEAKNTTVETIANESTAPSGPTFSHPTTYAGGISVGDLAAGDYRGFWVRRTIAAAQGAVAAYNFEITCEGETAA